MPTIDEYVNEVARLRARNKMLAIKLDVYENGGKFVTCHECEGKFAVFPPSRSTRKYCGDACRQRAYRRKNTEEKRRYRARLRMVK